MKMLDYVVMANSRLRENLARAVELTDPVGQGVYGVGFRRRPHRRIGFVSPLR